MIETRAKSKPIHPTSTSVVAKDKCDLWRDLSWHLGDQRADWVMERLDARGIEHAAVEAAIRLVVASCDARRPRTEMAFVAEQQAIQQVLRCFELITDREVLGWTMLPDGKQVACIEPLVHNPWPWSDGTPT